MKNNQIWMDFQGNVNNYIDLWNERIERKRVIKNVLGFWYE